MRDKDRYWDCLDQAMEASHGGRTDEALAWLDEALKAHPDGAEAHNSRGEILWDEGKVDEAVAEFELATRADPKFVAAHLNRAEVLVEEFGAHEESIAQCDRLLSGEGDLPRLDRNTEAEVYYLKSKALFYQDELDGSLFLVRRAMKTAGEQAVFRAFEGQILFEMGRFEESRRQLERAVALEPDAAHSLYYLGLVLERLGDAEESQARLRPRRLDRCQPLSGSRLDLRGGVRARRARGIREPAALDSRGSRARSACSSKSSRPKI